MPSTRTTLLQLTSINHRAPTAKACLICQKPIESIGGLKMVRSLWRGTKISTQAVSEGPVTDTKLGTTPPLPLRRCIKLLDEPEIYLIIWGGERFNSKEVIDRASKNYLASTQPWFCQKCGYRKCSDCGEPDVRLHHSDYVFDDGERGYHHPAQHPGASLGCINPNCEKYYRAEWRTRINE